MLKNIIINILIESLTSRILNGLWIRIRVFALDPDPPGLPENRNYAWAVSSVHGQFDLQGLRIIRGELTGVTGLISSAPSCRPIVRISSCIYSRARYIYIQHSAG